AIQEGTEWIADVLGEAASAEDREVMAAAGQAFLEEGKTIRGAADEQALDELLRSSFPEGTVLVFTAEAVDSRKKLFKTINEKGTVVACEVREQKYGAGLERSFFDEQVRAALNQKGKRIRPDALTVMYARSGKELRRLHAELEKLVAFLGEREEVTAQDVENLFADFHEAGVFDLANALRTADLKKCLPALHENLKTVENPLLTLGVIAAEVRRLMLARELLFTVFRSVWKPRMSYDQFVPVADKVRQEHQELMQKSKFRLLTLSDYSLYLLLKEAQRFTMERLFRIMEAVLEADTLMKSTTVGNRSPQSILENLIFTICAADDSKQQ
ncbi:MAG: hypothetical protein FJY85_14610, partial [Deltaproteobacteria bacterium]|nr:hypothetical protein [Deltaproteobacteria bacterium]